MSSSTYAILTASSLLLLGVGCTFTQKSVVNPVPASEIISVQDAVTTSTGAATSSEPAPDTMKPAEGQTTNTETAAQKAPTKKIVSLNVVGGSFFFTPNQLRVQKGDVVRLTFTNEGGMHNWNVDAFNVRMEALPAGESRTVEFVADTIGTFEYYCGVGRHRQMGQVGQLIVE